MSSENQNPYLEIIKDTEAANRGVMLKPSWGPEHQKYAAKPAIQTL
jgi:hypothetical protein